MSDQACRISRRDFIHGAAGAALGASALGAGPNRARAEQGATRIAPDNPIWRNKQPGMTYRRLGRTNYMCSRLAAGWRGNNRLRRMLIEKGVNYIDTSRAYANNEQEIAPLVKKFHDRLFLSSKASGLAGYPRLAFEPGEGAKAARMYNDLLDTSLRILGVDHLDCYYLHGVADPFVLETEELYAAFEKAHKAGKVLHNGFTTHTNVPQVLAKALELEEQGKTRFDLIMAACNPNSWPKLKDLVVKLRGREVGLICMKATGQVRAGRKPRVAELLKLAEDLELNDRERSYAYMLHIANFDVLISEMQNIKHVEGNLKLPGMRLAAADRRRLERMVMAEQRGACHHCGRCTAACPELVDVHDILRYHSYYHNYGHQQEACRRFNGLGYHPIAACSGCGWCNDACPAGIDLRAVIAGTTRDMA